MTPIQSAQEYVDSGCDQFSKEHIEALIAECERYEEALADIVLFHEGYCEHHVGVSKHSYELAGMASDAMLAARKEQS